MKESKCVGCGSTFYTVTNRHKYCGSIVNKIGCSYKNRIRCSLLHIKNNKNSYEIYQKIYRKKYHQTEKYKKLNRERRRDLFKNRVRGKVYYAVKTGVLIRPHTCSRCGNSSSYKIEGHHNDYLKPLEVIWLCKICHGKEHTVQ